jgi:hypothetical protein
MRIPKPIGPQRSGSRLLNQEQMYALFQTRYQTALAKQQEHLNRHSGKTKAAQLQEQATCVGCRVAKARIQRNLNGSERWLHPRPQSRRRRHAMS